MPVNHGKPVVKPFMLVVCKDTDHATWVEQFVKSDEFRGGAYRNKTIIVHSKQKGTETEANTRLLLDVENPENPVEIVIHVNMLKEGWDVNNLYTIVPLRTAASKILREQMVGRGLRLPYGERTGDRDVDAVMLTAHDKFNDILAEAQKGDSIFKAGNVIKAEEIKPEEVVYTQLTIETNPDAELEKAYVDAVGIIEAALRSANITENSLRTYWGENLYTFVNTSNVFAPLVEALQKTHSGTMDVRSIVVCAANAFESFLADFAIRKGVSLSGRNGILQKRDALSAHISKKHRGMIEFVGQVRNAADHGADPDENNQVWTISNETARIYPCIIAALIKAIFSRDATGSIEV